ncbi:aldehyde dehydrogenase family protein [Oryzicola mucosus]|uniref:Aldehyde dehydrogenase family protein n=1 Tax=Oryzicola mucosus TaxID=2767425 RepID=A0A8J6PZ38_9HYPH|nr:aldehyde dehydrogenase family protein [Oryzicola mucosus]MBD0417383.1 aldehyde dehydrogenase family protein [Oryzicola mucosus]
MRRANAFLAKEHRLLIDGNWAAAASGKTFEVKNPSNGAVISSVAEGSTMDVDRAAKAARRAFDSGPWSRMAPSERARLMRRLAELIEVNAQELAIIETMDNGKPFKMTLAENVRSAAEKFDYYSGWATKLRGETMEVSHNTHAFTLREAIGVAGLIIPWNVPLQSAAGKLAPALAAGCTAVLKPAEQTPLSALRLGELVLEAGFPEGVINIVTGFGHDAGAAIVDHPSIDKISFTGSTATGKKIICAATGTLKRVTLELGGKSPVIVFPDADVEQAVSGTATGVFRNSGQVCAAGTRLFVHRKVYDEVLEGVIERAKALKVGPGLEPGVDMGPLISDVQHAKVLGYVGAGLRDGASAAVGGNSIEGPGYFVEPTILTGTTENMSVRREEIFGPILCAVSFDEEDLDGIAAQANDTTYGLSARIYTRDISTALKMSRKVKAGSVRVNGGGIDINVPFGGYKQSGWGREGGLEGIENFTELKSVIVKL